MSRAVSIIERNESGNIVATYGQTLAATAATKKETTSLLQQLISIFLPAGFPASVTDDYVGYIFRATSLSDFYKPHPQFSITNCALCARLFC
ncbi:hypothetical protein K440DRAFT_405066 [Wilcoxina mikolae CBS 423.85]|nr:hypothetical protein K440DRAFT_405066 [Wilcoxina mikolae CBS 423.85]